jgi:NAD(P)-dependent dehydrogenase (short-subunit alcohol dehydrogenase family)
MQNMLIDNAHLNSHELRDHVIVVTGAGQGIGKAAALILARLGARVVIAEINDTGQETERLIRAAGGQALFVKTDVADPQSMEQLRDRVRAAFGPVDVLVNNAEATVMKLTVDHSLAEWERVFAVNLRGAFLGIKLFLPEMLRRKAGTIVTFESAEGMPFMSAYFASKVGLRSLALSLAQEVGDDSGVSVFCFGAGMVDTPTLAIAAHTLSGFYRITPEEFIRQSAPGGQLISAELCATGLVGAILHAREFHGQGDVFYLLGLSKLGLDPQGRPWSMAPAQPIAPAVLAEPSELADNPRQQAIDLNRQLEAIVRANQKEYDELSMFQRPIIKRMFQQGTGLKVEEWIASAAQMTQRLECDAPLDASTLQGYLAQLKRMIDFITRQESDARGWIKDPQQLQVALTALIQRKAIVTKLLAIMPQLK